MLRIFSSNIKSGQGFRPRNIMPDQHDIVCNDCGIPYADAGGEMYDCEHCGKPYCKNCIQQHERAHFEPQL